MQNIIIETARLQLREFTAEDAAGIFALNSNPDVMKYTGQPLMQNIEAAQNFIANYKEYELHGYGSLACICKETGAFVGAFGLRYFAPKNTTGMGGLFLPEYWGKGYATEAASACIKYGFEKLGLEEIIALAAADNKASVVVMDRIGMKPFEELDNNGVKVLIYKITRNNE